MRTGKSPIRVHQHGLIGKPKISWRGLKVSSQGWQHTARCTLSASKTSGSWRSQLHRNNLGVLSANQQLWGRRSGGIRKQLRVSTRCEQDVGGRLFLENIFYRQTCNRFCPYNFNFNWMHSMIVNFNFCFFNEGVFCFWCGQLRCISQT